MYRPKIPPRSPQIIAFLFLCWFCGFFWSSQAWALAPNALDLPPCEVSAPGKQSGVSLGLAQPYADSAVIEYVSKLTTSSQQVNVCSEAWSEVVPRFLPWAKQLERGYGFVVFVLAFLLAVTILYALTPRHWWHRTTLLGVLAVGSVTWLLACLLLAGLHALGAQRLVYGTAVSLRLPQQAQAEWVNVAGARELEALLAERKLLPPPVESKTKPSVGTSTAKPPAAEKAARAPKGEYRVYHRLNLREGAGTQYPYLGTLAVGTLVQFDGAQVGDWWRLRTNDGRVAWASSLWLRGPGEVEGSTDRTQN